MSTQVLKLFAKTLVWAGVTVAMTACQDATPTATSQCAPGKICTIAGTGIDGFSPDGAQARNTRLFWPVDIAQCSGVTYLIDWNNYRIRKIASDGTLQTVIGTDFAGDGDPQQLDATASGAPGTTVSLNHPSDLTCAAIDSAVAAKGTVIVTSWHNHRLRVLDPSTGTVFAHCGAQPGFFGDGDVVSPKTKFSQPSKSTQDSLGNTYIIDSRNWRIRKVATGGLVSTIAGNGKPGFDPASDTAPLEALKTPFLFFDPNEFSNPSNPGGGLALSKDEKTLYVADTMNHRIRAVDLVGGTVTTVAGSGTAGCWVPASHDATPCAQDGVNPVTTGDFSGDGGEAVKAHLNQPHDLAWGPDGRLYFADSLNHRIRALNLATGTIATVAGSGDPGTAAENSDTVDVGDGGDPLKAKLDQPWGIAFDAEGSLLIADTWHSRVRKVSAGGASSTPDVALKRPAVVEPPKCSGSGCITTVIGTGYAGRAAEGVVGWKSDLYWPQGVRYSPDGTVHYIDWNNHRIRTWNAATQLTQTVVGAGQLGDAGTGEPGTDARLNHPTGMAFAPSGNLWLAAWHNSKLKEFNVSSQILTDRVGTGARAFGGDGVAGGANKAKMDLPSSMVFTSQGDIVFSDQANQRIRKVDLTTLTVTTLVGDHWLTDDDTPKGKPLQDKDGNYLGCGQSPDGGRVNIPVANSAKCTYDATRDDHCFRDAAGAPVPFTPLPLYDNCGGAGQDGPAAKAWLHNTRGQNGFPNGRLAIDAKDVIYITDTFNQQIRTLDLKTMTVGTLAGTGKPGFQDGDAKSAQFLNPVDVTVALDGALLVADMGNHCIRRIKDGQVSTFAGQCGSKGFAGDGGPAGKAKFNSPYGVYAAPDGKVWIADTYNHRIRVVLP